MAESKIIINEFLTFVQNKIDVLDELSITQICASNFSDEEVETGKALLFNVCTETRRVQRKGEDKKKKNIKDVIKILKETDPAIQPTFVARDLNRLPPVSFDHVDVTRLLKDIVAMKTELSSLRIELASKGELITFQTNITSELNDLRASIGTALSTKNIKTANRVPSTIITPNYLRTSIGTDTSTKDTMNSIGDQSTPNKLTQNICRPTPTIGPSENVPTLHAATYRDIVQNTSKTQTTLNRPALSQKVHNIQDDDAEFTLVQRKKRTVRSNLCGTAQRACSILVADIPTFVYVSRLAKSTTAQDMLTHIRDMGQQCNDSDIQILNQKYEKPFNSFKIKISRNNLDIFLKNDFWPAGVKYRVFRERHIVKNVSTNEI